MAFLWSIGESKNALSINRALQAKNRGLNPLFLVPKGGLHLLWSIGESNP